ncbi:MAG: DNA mismatch repair protein MutS [Clostridia bacterium]
MPDFSPMMKQYFKIKEENPNCLVFFRLGDFYEMFFADAELVSKELELTLTGRECGQAEKAPMCGVPFHSAENYIARLVAKGYKVAICEQTESPAQAKGLVKREVVRIITPGTVLENSMLDETKNNYICSLFTKDKAVALSFADVSTGELHCIDFFVKKKAELYTLITNELSRFMPKEILINEEVFDIKNLDKFIKNKLSALIECMDEEVYQNPQEKLLENFDIEYLNSVSIFEHKEIVQSLVALFAYLDSTQKTETKRITEINYYAQSAFMKLDTTARKNLELTETLRGREKKGSLLWVLDKTKTAMGKRLIRTWMEQPLINPVKISARHNAVQELFENRMLSDEISEQLTGIYDIERIMTRIVYGSANARELRSLYYALSKLPEIKNILANTNSNYLRDIYEKIDVLEDLNFLIENSIEEEPPFSIREGGMIKKGYNEELDIIKKDMNGGKGLIAEIETAEKEKTGITKLKVGYNRVFGYYIEVTNSYKQQVPEHYIRKQTLANCERYITDELKKLETRILGAYEKSVALEGLIFEKIRQTVAKELARVEQTAKAIAKLDVINSFAFVAMKNNYTRPNINLNSNIYIKDGRHPVVELLLNSVPFVPNDTDMDMHSNRVAVITGPNMAGKSTFMRQVAIIVIMAQVGSFVPASTADICVVDQVFTRIGASDDLSAGQSTFMVEMSEVADILKNATKDSLIILDEIGRGTSTFDGMSIARAVLEHIHNTKQVGAKTLFATHYHELSELEDLFDGVKNYNIAVKKRGDDITFLRRIVRGGCDDSYGIQVAKLAGVPDKVVERAKEVLLSLENGTATKIEKKVKAEEPQMSFDTNSNAIMTKIRNIDVNTLTPIECMNVLFELSSMLDK